VAWWDRWETAEISLGKFWRLERLGESLAARILIEAHGGSYEELAACEDDVQAACVCEMWLRPNDRCCRGPGATSVRDRLGAQPSQELQNSISPSSRGQKFPSSSKFDRDWKSIVLVLTKNHSKAVTA
jgi:hypothetical protein